MSQKSPLLSGYARDAVVFWLEKNLNNALNDKDVIRADGIELEPIDGSRIYIDESFQPLRYPAMYVLAPEMTFDYTGAPNYVQAEIPIQTIVVCEEAQWEKLQEKLESYARAIFKIMDQVSLQDKDARFQLKMISKKIEYTKTFRPAQAAGQRFYRKAVIYRWNAKHFENRLTT